MNSFQIRYYFTMEDGKQEDFHVQLDSEQLEVISASGHKRPEWTRLAFHQCPNCTLTPDKHPYCPPAVNMVDLVKRFDDLLSFDKTTVLVEVDDRRIKASTSVQRAVSSLMGLLMAASGCPLTVFFKPMARFHWPFASMDETLWRAISAYLISQYFLNLDGDTVDTQLTGLSQIYQEIQTVNMAFAQRLRHVCHYDGMVNGIILLDMFAKSMPDVIDEALAEMEHLFTLYHQHNNSLEPG